jgi:hypothetical protein
MTSQITNLKRIEGFLGLRKCYQCGGETLVPVVKHSVSDSKAWKKKILVYSALVTVLRYTPVVLEHHIPSPMANCERIVPFPLRWVMNLFYKVNHPLKLKSSRRYKSWSYFISTTSSICSLSWLKRRHSALPLLRVQNLFLTFLAAENLSRCVL